jgi:uncharacterized delta-60 repeat protein
MVAPAALVVGFVLVTGAAATAGDLDPTFGASGIVTTNLGGDEAANAVALQADGRIVVAGETTTGSTFGDFAVARYETDGTLDSTFGAGGTAVGDLFSIPAGARDVVIQPDGKILAAGHALNFNAFALVRYNPDGTLDTSFGSGGKVSFAAGVAAFGLALQADGKIVAAGDALSASGTRIGFAIARFNPDGAPDPSFDGDGRVVTPFSFLGGATSVVLQEDGKIVVAGTGDANFALARYNADGSLDTTFDGDGKVSTNLGGFDSILALALQPDGKLVAAGLRGSITGGLTRLAAVARFNSDGTLDASFGAGGTLTTDFGGAPEALADALSIDPEGRILVAGTRGSGAATDFVVARYDAFGAPDASFGSNGLVTTDLGGTDALQDIALQENGRIVVAGFASGDMALARYLGDPTAIEVAADIRPGGGTNPINLAAKGVVPVAILTTDTFDATSVDPATVCFGDDDDAGRRDCTEAHGTGHAEDVDGDNRADLLLHFEIGETGIEPGDIRACVTGTTGAGIEIEGCDAIATR